MSNEGKEIRSILEKLLPPASIEDSPQSYIHQSERFNDWLEEITRALPQKVGEEKKKLLALERQCMRIPAVSRHREEAFAAAARKLSRMQADHKGLFGITFHFDPGKIFFEEEEIREMPNFPGLLKACRDLGVNLHFLAQDAHDDCADIDVRTSKHRTGDIYFIVDASESLCAVWQEELDELMPDEAGMKTTTYHNPKIPPVSKRTGSGVKKGHLRLVPRPAGSKPA